MKALLRSITLGLVALALTGCGGIPLTVSPTVQPALPLPVRSTSEPATETFRIDSASGVVTAFVEELTPQMSEKVAYVTHVSSGSQTV
jgi:hypothetical protein